NNGASTETFLWVADRGSWQGAPSCAAPQTRAAGRGKRASIDGDFVPAWNASDEPAFIRAML
ncbi:hypothetical protein, partial [Burkholderia ambifaria]|uniref:hypothetical protein n=1 Tax=Burkholderia ambifaria TaxID=152480 RepID=UPI001ABA795D